MLRPWTGWRTSTRLTVAGVTLGALIAAVPAVSASTGGHTAPGSPVVGTANGAVRGTSSGSVSEFLGIPYAAPPVGALRWQPPQPAANWSGVRDATQFAPHCPQPASPFGQASTSEDCLFLNVFTPSRQEAGAHPVMVWIHGGALVSGESNDYNPTKLVEIQYIMDLPTAAFPGTLSAQQQQLATIMKSYWTNFAKRGFPTSFGTPFWPHFNSVTQQIQSLVPPAPQTETNFAATHKCAFWAAV